MSSTNRSPPHGVDLKEVMREMGRMLELTQDMFEAANNAEWEHVVDLWEIRFPTLKQIFAVPIPQEVSAEVIGVLRDIYAIEQEILRMGEENRALISQKLSELQQGKFASQFYKGIFA